jgi:flagellar hook-associated protein 3 FlgL
MRIATSTITAIGTSGMNSSQSQLVDLLTEISTNRTVNDPGDNGVAAAQSVGVQTAVQVNTQYGANQNVATTSLGLEDTTLKSVTSTLQDIQTVINKANNGSLTDQDRASYAAELQSDRAELLSLANTTDANGNYIFGGFQTSNPPFVNNSNGIGATYVGDQGQINSQVSAQRQLPTNDPGSNIFMTATPGASLPIPSAANDNTGAGTIGVVSTTQSGAPSNADSYTVSFQVDANGDTTYTVQDTTPSGTPPVLQPPTDPQPYTAGAAINLGAGQTITINGKPADGDSFNVAPPTAAQSNIFTTLDNLISTLQSPQQSAAGQTNIANQLATFGTQVANTYTTVLTVHASVGARETEVNTLATQSTNTDLAYSTQLSNLVGLTTAQSAGVYSQLSEIQTQLSATQKAYTTVQGLSLFSMINV